MLVDMANVYSAIPAIDWDTSKSTAANRTLSIATETIVEPIWNTSTDLKCSEMNIPFF